MLLLNSTIEHFKTFVSSNIYFILNFLLSHVIFKFILDITDINESKTLRGNLDHNIKLKSPTRLEQAWWTNAHDFSSVVRPVLIIIFSSYFLHIII